MTEKAEPMGCDTEAINRLRRLGHDAFADRLAYLSAQEGLLFKCEAHAAQLAAELAEIKRPLESQMARLNSQIIDLRPDAERWRYLTSRMTACVVRTPDDKGVEVWATTDHPKHTWNRRVDLAMVYAGKL